MLQPTEMEMARMATEQMATAPVGTAASITFTNQVPSRFPDHATSSFNAACIGMVKVFT
jgi:hypothetical protein